MATSILTTAEVVENTEKTGLQIVYQKSQSSGYDTMLKILNDSIVFLKK